MTKYFLIAAPENSTLCYIDSFDSMEDAVAYKTRVHPAERCVIVKGDASKEAEIRKWIDESITRH